MTKSPKQNDMYITLKKLSKYFNPNKYWLILVLLLSGISGIVGIIGSYLLRPIINNYIIPGDTRGLLYSVIVLIVIYLSGVISTFLCNQIMVKITQKIIYELR